jgi:cytochrome oxidase assembly protein ShyY1
MSAALLVRLTVPARSGGYRRLVEARRALGILRQPSWIGLTVLVLVLCLGFTELGLWQLRRHDDRAARNEMLAASLAAAPVPVGDLLDADPLSTADEWRTVSATGSYDSASELLVRNSSYGGELGYAVVTPLVPTSGPALLVVRGWVPIGAEAATVPEVPAAPSGTVTVLARVRPTETGGTDAAGLPDRQVRRLDVPEIADSLPYQVLEGGFAQLVPGAAGSDDGAAGPRPLMLPEPGAGPHRPYAIQWFLFAVIAIVGWVMLLRAAANESTGAIERPAATAEPR